MTRRAGMVGDRAALSLAHTRAPTVSQVVFVKVATSNPSRARAGRRLGAAPATAAAPNALCSSRALGVSRAG